MKPKNPINEMEKKAKKIKKIQFITNTILANACYHEKEMENQIQTAERLGKLTAIEKDLLGHAWNYRSMLANELIEELNSYMRGDLNKRNKKEKGNS